MNRQISDRRLLKLATFLKTVPPKRFDYGRWVGEDWKGAKDLSCGTTACALGWATAMPSFRRLGLVLKKKWGEGIVTLASTPRNSDSLDAAQKIFGLDRLEALFLFIPGEWLDNRKGPILGATPKEVAKHIEQFVKARSKRSPVAA